MVAIRRPSASGGSVTAGSGAVRASLEDLADQRGELAAGLRSASAWAARSGSGMSAEGISGGGLERGGQAKGAGRRIGDVKAVEQAVEVGGPGDGRDAVEVARRARRVGRRRRVAAKTRIRPALRTASSSGRRAGA
jgi:hypothetical protein